MELFRLLGTIAIDNSSANKALDETSALGNKTQSKLSKAFSGIGRGALAVGKAVGTGMIAAGTAVAGLVGVSTQAYAQYEQLVGGVETLFGAGGKNIEEYAESVGKSVSEIRAEYNNLMTAEQDVLNNAKNAYKTAGLSANEYMETVTGFAASLLQSLDGDTVKAAAKADMAIQDMSDNANKMGTAMESIQHAYQGFAKQNYTMLDNLKLGYGGTKAEMERLLEDAQAISGIEYDISSYGDVVDAIHVIQNEMGITGTTAKEAAETITGSTAAMKAAWQNLMTAMADDNANVSEYITTFVNSAETALQNYIPRIGIALQGVVQLVEQLAPVVIAKIPELVGQLLPAIISAATGLIDSLVAILPQLVDTLVNNVLPQLLQGFGTIISSLIAALPQIMQTLGSAISTQAPVLLAGIGTIITNIATYIQENLPIVTEKAKAMMDGFGAKIQENIPEVISKGLEILLGLSESILANIPTLVATGMELIKSLVIGIVNALPDLIAQAPQIITNFANAFSSSMATIFMKGIEIIWELIKGIISAIPDLIANIPQIIQSIVAVWNAMNWSSMGKNLISGIKSGVQGMAGSLKSTVSNLFQNAKTLITNPLEAAKSAVKGIVDAIKGFFSGLKLTLPHIKLPHFSISGTLSLNPPSVPSLSISWYKKAMDNPLIMNKPTIFGYNGATGELMGGGEAGSEVVAGADTLMNMIQTAVSNQSNGLASRLDKLIDMLAQYFPESLEAMKTPATFDPDTAARSMAVSMNRELGKIATLQWRGR